MKKAIEKGDEFTVTFIKNEKSNRPICRINGIVAFVDNKCKEFVKVGSSYIVRVTAIKKKCLLIEPLTILKTSEENEVIFKQRLELLKAEKTAKYKKSKKGYQYKSKSELKKE